jgi:hypothetical protein
MTGTLRYRMEQNESGRWIIASTASPEMCWCGSHRGFRDQGASVSRLRCRWRSY